MTQINKHNNKINKQKLNIYIYTFIKRYTYIH